MAKQVNQKEDPLTQVVTTVGPRGEMVELKPFQVMATDGDAVEGFAGGTTAEPPKPRFEIKGVIRIS